jgi:hypothetical protein
MKQTKGHKWEVVHRDDEKHMCMSVIAPVGSMGDAGNIMQLQDDPNHNKVVAIVFHQCYPFVNNSESLEFEDKNEIERLIASAPEMLDLLISAFGLMTSLPNRTYSEALWMNEAHSIIKRIKG